MYVRFSSQKNIHANFFCQTKQTQHEMKPAGRAGTDIPEQKAPARLGCVACASGAHLRARDRVRGTRCGATSHARTCRHLCSPAGRRVASRCQASLQPLRLSIPLAVQDARLLE